MPDITEEGAPIDVRDETCARCGGVIPWQGSFCPHCGKPKAAPAMRSGYERPPVAQPLPPRVRYDHYMAGGRPVRSWRDVGRTISAISMASFAIYLVLCLFTLIYGIEMVYPELENRSFTQYVVLIGVSPLVTISGELLQGWYIFLVGAIVASAIWMALTSRRRYLNEMTMKGESRNHSAFFEMCGLMFMVFFVNTLIVLVMMAAGADPSDPTEESETWELLFLLANASVWEELITRVLLIGLPLIAVDAVRRRYRKVWRYLLGGGIQFGKAEVGLILLSAAAFGLAHFDGWGAWKVFPSSLAGVAFGYIFLKHGLAASIMLHFSFDYLSAPLLVFEDSIGLQVVVGIGILLWLGIGLVFVIYYATRVVEFISGRRLFEPARAMPAVAAVPSQWQPPYQHTEDSIHGSRSGGSSVSSEQGRGSFVGFGGGFICSACGSTAARWQAGGLQCLRCGRIFK